jgi:signal transduction histidine kinase
MPVSRSALLQNLRIGLLVLDARGYVIDHNPAIDRIFGLNGVYIGHKAAEFPPLRDFFLKIGYVPGSDPPRIPLGRYDIGNLTYAWQFQPEATDSGSCVFIIENISAQIALERDVNRIKAEFIKREKLVSIGQLSAGLAHEINNPLAYLKSDLRSLERLIERKLVTDADKDLKEIVQITKGIDSGLDRIGKVVQSLLSFTRKGTMDDNAELYDLHEGIDSTLEIMHYEYREIADIKKDYGTIPPIVTQRNEINQVLFNILTNAIQAIREHPAEDGYRGLITIRTGFSKMHVWCEIENNGPPISPETAPRVFELFFTTKAENLGTGLGLNYSQDIVEHRNHGRLTLVSCDPVVFRMELPAVDG